MSIRDSLMSVMQRRSVLPDVVDSVLSGRPRELAGLTVVVTGASSGIGRHAAVQLTARGARVIAVARREDELAELAAETGCTYRVCDLSDEAAIAGLIADLADVPVDVLVNNAGRSIRRPIAASTDRFHDFQRTMSLNYFAAVQLTLGLLPGMIERGGGQFVNVCTWSLHANTFPKFAAYAASKNALAVFGRSLNAERPHPNVRVTNVFFPLVRTDMISPTADFDELPALSVDDAASWIMHAIKHQPVEVSPAMLRSVLPVIDYFSPRAADRFIASLT